MSGITKMMEEGSFHMTKVLGNIMKRKKKWNCLQLGDNTEVVNIKKVCSRHHENQILPRTVSKVHYELFPRCTTSALTSKAARCLFCAQSPGTTSTYGFCQLRWRFFLVKLGLWSPYGTCSMLIKKTFGNVSIQQLSFRSTIFVPSPDKPRRYAQPWSPVEQVEIGTHEEQSLFSTLTP